MKCMSNLFTLLLVTGVLQPSKAQSVCSSALALKYERQERLSDGYHVFWSVDSAAQRLTFGFCVATQGWIGFGLSPSDGMKGADVMIARRDADSGEFDVGDYFSEDFVTPVLDQQQDWHLVQGQRNLSHTFVEVWRSIKTCDDLDHDFKLLPQRAVYAYGYSDAIKQHAPTSRGSLLMKFLSPWLTPPEQGTTIVDVQMPNVTLPAKHSFYHCAVVSMDLPTNTRLHATAWTILPGSSPYKHHQFMYNCPPEVLESYELNTAFSCDNIMPDVCHLVANVGNNEEVVVLPAETGLPLGGTDEDCASFSDSSFPCVRLALLEFHMEVTTGEALVNPTLGFRFYATEKLRPHPFGFFVIQARSPTITVPPHSSQVVTSRCNCFDDIDVAPTLLVIAPHMHRIGQTFALRHVRDGQEVGVYGKRSHFDDKFVPYDLVNKKVLPGDSFELECGYTNDGNSTVQGGTSRDEEMCRAYTGIYPALPFSTCVDMHDVLPNQMFCGHEIRDVLESPNGSLIQDVLDVSSSKNTLLPFDKSKPFTRLEDRNDVLINPCIVYAYHRINNPADVGVITLAGVLPTLGTFCLFKLIHVIMMYGPGTKYREMIEGNRRNVQAYLGGICVLVASCFFLVYIPWGTPTSDGLMNYKEGATWTAPAYALVVGLYMVEILYRTKVHVTSTLHHLVTIIVIMGYMIALYDSGNQEVIFQGKIVLLWAIVDIPNHCIMLSHRFFPRYDYYGFTFAKVWTALSKTVVFIFIIVYHPWNPEKPRSWLPDSAWPFLFRYVMPLLLGCLFILQGYQTYVFHVMAKKASTDGKFREKAELIDDTDLLEAAPDEGSAAPDEDGSATSQNALDEGEEQPSRPVRNKRRGGFLER